MKRLYKIISALLVLSVSVLPSMAASGYVETIQTESNGNVIIDIPTDIMNIIFPPVRNTGNVGHGAGPKKKEVKVNVLHSGVNKLSGYRVQVFSQGSGQGSGQASVETKAKARGSAIVAKFPKYRGQVYSYSVSPNWYTRVGNFQTSEEANRALGELKRAFPQFAGEMRVVKSQITIVK